MLHEGAAEPPSSSEGATGGPAIYVKELEMQPLLVRLTCVPYGGSELDRLEGYRLLDKAPCPCSCCP